MLYIFQDGPWAVERCGEGHPFMCESVFQGKFLLTNNLSNVQSNIKKMQ